MIEYDATILEYDDAAGYAVVEYSPVDTSLPTITKSVRMPLYKCTADQVAVIRDRKIEQRAPISEWTRILHQREVQADIDNPDTETEASTPEQRERACQGTTVRKIHREPGERKLGT